VATLRILPVETAVAGSSDLPLLILENAWKSAWVMHPFFILTDNDLSPGHVYNAIGCNKSE